MIILIIITTLFFTSCSDIFGEDPIYGCLDQTACNYNSNANTSDRSCIYIAITECDCYGNIIDECGQCGGGGEDVDDDGICDDLDICIGDYNNDYYCKDMQVLQDFINGNNSINTLYVDDLYLESWWNDYGRLEYLSLDGLGLSYVPESIGDLESLRTLYLNNNNLESIPNSICELNNSCQIFIQCNNLSSEYHFNCINHFTSQFCDEQE